jgi:poly(A) polymerase
LVYTTTWYIGLTLPEGEHKSLDISYPVASFKGQVTTASTYDPETMSVRVVHARAHQLPDDVFRPGETRPVKPVKEKKKKAQTKSTKRSFAETGIDDSEHAPTKRRESVNAQGLSRPTPV